MNNTSLDRESIDISEFNIKNSKNIEIELIF